MTITFPRARQSIYELSEGLRGESIPLAVRTAAPNEAEREETVLRKLGAKAWGRLHHFCQYYSQGWGEGAGRPLSPRALEPVLMARVVASTTRSAGRGLGRDSDNFQPREAQLGKADWGKDGPHDRAE